MKFSRRIAVFLVTGLVVGAAAAQADQGVSTAQVLGQLHSGNVREMRMGTLAMQNGKSQDVQVFGKTLVTDHDAADTKVVLLAKEKGITLAANTPPVPPIHMPMGDDFDAAFAKMMLKEHQRTIADVKDARDGTRDAKLKALLIELLPVLEQHEATAQALVDKSPKS
jgi:putative membrane protein